MTRRGSAAIFGALVVMCVIASLSGAARAEAATCTPEASVPFLTPDDIIAPGASTGCGGVTYTFRLTLQYQNSSGWVQIGTVFQEQQTGNEGFDLNAQAASACVSGRHYRTRVEVSNSNFDRIDWSSGVVLC